MKNKSGINIGVFKKTYQRVSSIIFGAIAIAFFVTNRVPFDLSLKLVYFFASAIIALYFPSILRNKQMEKYFERSTLPWLAIITLYGAFALTGQTLFLNDAGIQISAGRMFRFLLAALVMLHYDIALLYALECLNQKVRYDASSKKGALSSRKMFFILFTTFFVIWLVALISCFPANMTSDTYDQINQATGVWGISNHHPAFHTLAIKWAYLLYPSPFTVGTFQILFGAAVFAATFTYLYNKCQRFTLVFMCAVIMALLPSNLTMMTVIWKDIPYTISLLWATYLLLLIGEDKAEFFGKRFHFLILALCMAAIYLFRHNGIIPFTFIIAYTLIIAIKIEKWARWRAVASAVLGIVLVMLVSGPVFKHYKVAEGGVRGTSYTTMLNAMGAVLHSGGTLSGETISMMESTTMSAEEYRSLYNQFNGDSYIFGRDGKGWNRSVLKGSDVFKGYFEALFKYPTIVVKDRLEGANILWDVTEPSSSFNSRYAIGYYDAGKGYIVYDSALATAINSYADASCSIQIVDIFVWRSGVYFIIFFVLFLYWVKNRYTHLFAASIAFAANTLSMLLTLYHQSFRYIYYVPMTVILLLLVTIVQTDKKGRKKA